MIGREREGTREGESEGKRGGGRETGCVWKKTAKEKEGEKERQNVSVREKAGKKA